MFQHSGEISADPTYVGIAIKATSVHTRGMHVGILYRSSADSVNFAHLAWHNDLRNEKLSSSGNYFWAECEWLNQDDSLSEFVANFVEMCVQSKEIPYGPNPPAAAFDSSGRYSPQSDREGLTCATFVSSVFDGAGLPVVDLTTWESRPDDAVWWNSMMEHLEDSVPERASELVGVAVDFRLRPDEVAVAATHVDRPLTYEDAVTLSLPVQRLLFPSSESNGDHGDAVLEESS